MQYVINLFSAMAIAWLVKKENDEELSFFGRGKVFLTYFLLFCLESMGVSFSIRGLGFGEVPKGTALDFILLFLTVVSIRTAIFAFSVIPEFACEKVFFREKCFPWIKKVVLSLFAEFLAVSYPFFYPAVSSRLRFLMLIVLDGLLIGRVYLEEEKKSVTVGAAFLCLWDILFYYLGFLIYSPGVGTNLTYSVITILFLLCFSSVLLLLTGKIYRTVLLTGILYLLWTLVHYYVLMFRGTPLIPSDWKNVGTAFEVVNAYNFTISKEMWWYVSALLLLFAFRTCIKEKSFPLQKKYRLITCVLFCAGLIFSYKKLDLTKELNLSISAWKQTDDYHYYGQTLAYYIMQKKTKISVPEEYNISELENLAVQYAEEEKTAESYPDIIVIMNESFVDMGDVGTLHVNQDYMPFIHSLQEKKDFLTGRVLVSAFGGGTANSEWEFLTGYSKEFTAGNVPYMSESFSNTDTVVSLLNQNGYRTIATHPCPETNWRRNTVYEQMGFDETYFIDDYKDYELIKGTNPSDRDVYKKITELLDQSNNPTFLFAITMQNHGGYSADYLRKGDSSFTIQDTTICEEPLNQYLSLIYESDAAFEELIREIDNREKETVVVMFGDHFPNLGDTIYQYIRGGDVKTLADYQVVSSTPCIVHANYDFDYEAMKDYMSVNYLGANLLHAIGLPMTPFYRYELAMQEIVPAFNNAGYLDAVGNWHSYKEDDDSEEYQWIKTYNCMTYNARFDQKKTVKALFSPDR